MSTVTTTLTFSAPPTTTTTTTSFSTPSTFSAPSAPSSTFSAPKLEGTTVSFSNGPCYAGLKWDGTKDLDLSCVVYTQFGDVADAAYFKRLSIFDGVITHSGDKKDGVLHGYDEAITLSLNKLDDSLGRFVYVMVNSPKKDLIKAQLHIGDGDKEGGRVIEKYDTESLSWKNKSGFLAGVFVRSVVGSSWVWQSIGIGIEATTFKGVTPLIEANLKQHVDPKILAMRPREVGKKFDLQKAEMYGIPKGINKVVMGLGWNTQCDVDAHCYTFDKNLSPVGHVWYKDLQDPGIKHTGDNRTGEGSGDDEQICITFDSVEKRVEHLLFMVQIYEGANDFSRVRGCYCRMVSSSDGQELCRYTLSRSGSTGKSCCMSVLSRSVFGWALTIVGEESNYAPATVLSSTLGMLMDVSLTVVKGSDLIAKDKSGTSDPYVKVKSPAFAQGKNSWFEDKSKVIKKTLNPNWNFKCKNFRFRKDSATINKSITVKCFDHDRLSRDDPMGMVELSIKSLLVQVDGEPHEVEIPLKTQKGEEFNGTITLSFTVNVAYL